MTELQLFLVLILAISAGHKLVQRDQLALATARLLGLSAHNAAATLLLAATAEAMTALALALLATRFGGAIAAAAIWTAYSIALLRHRGEVLDCGCDLVRRARPVGAFAIARPALLALLALAVALLPSDRWSIVTPFAAAALLALWFAASELAAIPQFARSTGRTGS